MMEKGWTPLPDIHSMKAVIMKFLPGDHAISWAFCAGGAAAGVGALWPQDGKAARLSHLELQRGHVEALLLGQL